MPNPPEPKHPREMTTEEAINHLFHPKIVEHAKNLAANPDKVRTPRKKPTPKG